LKDLTRKEAEIRDHTRLYSLVLAQGGVVWAAEVGWTNKECKLSSLAFAPAKIRWRPHACTLWLNSRPTNVSISKPEPSI
jgi:hypothetical protein